MIYAIDIETTGLNPRRCDILEIAAIKFDPRDPQPIGDLDRFHCLVKHDWYEGEAFALAMNARLLDMLSGRVSCPYPIYDVREVVVQLKEFFGSEKVILAGKNVGSFDLRFLEGLPYWSDTIKVAHRSLDPGSLYFDPSRDLVPPGLYDCQVRAGLGEAPVEHTAMADAELVLRVLRAKWGI